MKLQLLILDENGHELNNIDICNLAEPDCFDVANDNDVTEMVEAIRGTFSNPVVPPKQIKWLSI